MVCVGMLIGGDEPLYWRIVILFPYLVLVSGMCFFLIRPMVRVRPASLVLGKDDVRYDPGNVAAVLLRLGFCIFFFPHAMGTVQGRTRAFTMPKSELNTRLTDETWCGRGRRLILAGNGRETEIASELTDADRIWLFEVIEEWRLASPAE